MNDSDHQAIDAAYAAQIKQIFEGICSDLAMGVKPGGAAFDELMRRAGDGIKRARYVKGILAGLVDELG